MVVTTRTILFVIIVLVAMAVETKRIEVQRINMVRGEEIREEEGERGETNRSGKERNTVELCLEKAGLLARMIRAQILFSMMNHSFRRLQQRKRIERLLI